MTRIEYLLILKDEMDIFEQCCKNLGLNYNLMESDSEIYESYCVKTSDPTSIFHLGRHFQMEVVYRLTKI